MFELDRKRRIFYGMFAASIVGFTLTVYMLRHPRNLTSQNSLKPIPMLPTPETTDRAQSSRTLNAKGFNGTANDHALMKEIVRLFEKEDLPTALKLAQEGLRNSQISERMKRWIESQLSTLFIAASWQHLKNENCYEAIDLLRQAEERGKDPAIYRGLAFCYAKLQNTTQASLYFDEYLSGNPSDKDMIRLYANTLESDLRFQDAATMLEKYSAANPDDQPLKELFATMRAKALESPKQGVMTSANFRLIYRSDEHGDLADIILEALESSLGEFCSRYGFKNPSQQIDVILYPLEQFRAVTQGGPNWAAGIFDGSIRVPVHKDFFKRPIHRELARTLRHELTHALIAMMNGHRPTPSWFSEGLAQLLECPDHICQPDRKVFSLNPGKFLSEQELNNPFIGYDKIRADKSYRQSLFLTQVLLMKSEYDAADSLERVIGPIEKNTPMTNEALLKPINVHFLKLYKDAAQLWQDAKLPRVGT